LLEKLYDSHVILTLKETVLGFTPEQYETLTGLETRLRQYVDELKTTKRFEEELAKFKPQAKVHKTAKEQEELERLKAQNPDISEYESFLEQITQAKQKQEFDLSNIMSKEIEEKEVPSSVTQTQHGTFLFTLPRLGVSVEFRLMTSADESKIAKQVISKKEIDNVSTGQLKTCIVSVNGMYDPQSIKQVSDNMIASDARALRNVIKDLTPEVDMEQDFSCENCGHEEGLEVPLTAEFFWPK